MTALLIEILGSWTRIALAAATAYLVDHHIVTADQGGRLGELLYHHILDFAPIAFAMVWAIAKNYYAKVKLHTALDMPAGSSVDSLQTRISNGLGASATRAVALLLAVGVAGAVLAACTSLPVVRRAAIAADQSFATAVFALDDAEWAVYQACVPDAACEARHQQLNPPIKRALTDVKAVTAALKAAKNGTLPTSLPDLLKDLADVQAVINALQPVVPKSLADKVSTANQKALALLAQFAGGQ
jgi:hypothetical protein